MYELLHAGFDTLDIAFAGALPQETLSYLEQANKEAQRDQTPVLVTIGPGKIKAHLAGHGMKGGYAFVLDTGPLGAQYRFKNNSDNRQWNIFVSPHATALLAHGYHGIKNHLFETFAAMGAKITNHSINRVDFAMDFRTHGFELRQDQFVAHSHTKVKSHWSEPGSTPDLNKPATVMRGRRLESVTIGKQPGRQIIVYDKRREAIERQKHFWFEVWGLSPADPNLEVWRIEVRAGKNELVKKYKLTTFADFECGIGDVLTRALQDIRYLADFQTDGNVSRQELHPLWEAAQQAASGNLLEFQSGLTPGQIVAIERNQAIEQYRTLCAGNAIGYGVSSGLTDEEILEQLPDILAASAKEKVQSDKTRFLKSVARARNKLHFITPQSC